MFDDSKIVVSEHYDGVLVVDSRLIAAELNVDHNDWINNVVMPYQTQAEQAFGVLRFENVKPPPGSRGGRPQRIAWLTEDQATFFMTLSRNTPEVVKCKIGLVAAFSRAKDLLRNRQPREAYVPYWYQRLQLAMSDTELPLQAGYFCIYQEIMAVFAELETRFSYVIKDYDEITGQYLIPDISIAKGFNSFLRNDEDDASFVRQHFLGVTVPVDFRDNGTHAAEIEYYNHIYPRVSHGDYQRQRARSYPNRYLEIFRYYLQEHWLPDRCVNYLAQRDPQGIAAIQAQVIAMSPAERNALSATLTGKLINALFSLPPQ